MGCVCAGLAGWLSGWLAGSLCISGSVAGVRLDARICSSSRLRRAGRTGICVCLEFWTGSSRLWQQQAVAAAGCGSSRLWQQGCVCGWCVHVLGAGAGHGVIWGIEGWAAFCSTLRCRQERLQWKAFQAFALFQESVPGWCVPGYAVLTGVNTADVDHRHTPDHDTIQTQAVRQMRGSRPAKARTARCVRPASRLARLDCTRDCGGNTSGGARGALPLCARARVLQWQFNCCNCPPRCVQHLQPPDQTRPLQVHSGSCQHSSSCSGGAGGRRNLLLQSTAVDSQLAVPPSLPLSPPVPCPGAERILGATTV
jgi:hypothetical protein